MPVHTSNSLSTGFLFGAVFEDASIGNMYSVSTTRNHHHLYTSNPIITANNASRAWRRSTEQAVVRRPSVDEYSSSEGFNMYDYVSSHTHSNEIKRPDHEAHLYCACERHLRQRVTRQLWLYNVHTRCELFEYCTVHLYILMYNVNQRRYLHKCKKLKRLKSYLFVSIESFTCDFFK